MEAWFNVLIAEDNPMDVNLLKFALVRAKLDWDITVVNNGEKAMDVLNKSREYREIKNPDMILMDMKLPRVSGSELISYMQSKPEFRNIPVIVITSSDAQADRSCAAQSGAKAMITKPMDMAGYDEMALKIASIAKELK